MTLLAPWALALAALAAVPLALHLLRRDTARRIAFPAVRFLRTAHRRSARALRIRDRLLMLVRVGLVACLAVAAAGPLVGHGDTADHWPTDAVFIIDNSASTGRMTGDRTILSALVSRAHEALDRSTGADRFWILSAVDGPHAAAVGAGQAAAALERVEPADGAADLVGLVREAVRLLPGDEGRHREILVLSDFQEASIADSLPALPEGIGLVLSPGRADEANGAVVAARADPPVPGAGVGLSVDLWTSAEPDDSVDVRLSLDGATAAIRRSPAAGTLEFLIPPLDPGEHVATVEIPPAGLRADDRLSIALRAVAPPRIAHIGDADSYVAQALSTLAGAGRLSVVRETTLADGLVVEASDGDIPRIQTGSTRLTVLIPPSDPLHLARFNAALERHGIGWRLELDEAPGQLGFAPGQELPGLDRVRVLRRYDLRARAPGADSVLLRMDDGAPWAVRVLARGTVHLLLGSALEPAATTLPVDAAMVPFLELITLGWSGLGGRASAATPAGNELPLAPDADSVASPYGQVSPVDDASSYIGRRAGVFTVFAGSVRHSVAVRVPQAESDLRTADLKSAARRLGEPRAQIATTDSDWLDSVFGSRRGASGVPGLLSIVLLLAVAEVLVATAGRPRRAAPEGAGP